MAKPKHIYLTGKGSWFHKLFEPDEYLGDKRWKISFYPDPKSMEKFKELKTVNRFKTDKDGTYVVLSRPVDKPWQIKDGESPEFDPPRVTDSEGNLWPDDKIIGNGSEVTVKLEVYNYSYKGRSGTAARLEAVRVDDWVEYQKPDETAPTPPAAPANTQAFVDDTIPF